MSKGKAKAQVQLQHDKLAAQDDAARLKAYWSERFDLLADVLASA